MKLAIALLTVLLPLAAHANTENFSVRHAALAAPSALVEGSYQQAIDHSGAISGTFSQRYWVDSEFATSANAPVIYHLCGEANCTEGYFLHDSAIQWAKQLGARLVYLEHRYYGASVPFNDLSNAHLKYLTLHNVLEDLATFQKSITAKNAWTGKWIVVGGSYSATLSAIYRYKHPELVVGALAASAPMISGVGEVQHGGPGDMSSTNPANDSRVWGYQACSELGFWEASGGSIDSTILVPGQDLCQSAFGAAPYFNANQYNQEYHLPFLTNASDSPSNILFTYGSEDVWTNLGLDQQQNANTKIVIHNIPGAGHHFDLNAASFGDSQAVKDARNLFLNLAKGWLAQ